MVESRTFPAPPRRFTWSAWVWCKGSGLQSLIMLGRGVPMSVILTPGQTGDNPQLLPLLDQIAVSRDGPGRPRKRPERVLADNAHSHPLAAE
ncbi:transposase [Micromonospora sp. 067-2]|uniref:transposase n=1 Tax=Micromonospora sp. 067-2 TaxID=2789270 RepID=UPI00397B35FA